MCEAFIFLSIFIYIYIYCLKNDRINTFFISCFSLKHFFESHYMESHYIGPKNSFECSDKGLILQGQRF